MKTALVLGGGGLAGIAWETGLLKGLREHGVDLTGADLIIGTSAGSVVGTQIATGCDLDELFARQVRPHDASLEQSPGADMNALMAAFAPLRQPGMPTPELMAQVGAIALEAETPSEESRIATISARLPVQEWPERALRITTVDALSGEFVVWDKLAGVPLPLAVASSCAVPIVYPPTTIHSRRYMDGGVRSATNADLATGYERVVVLAVTPDMPGASAPLEREVELLRASGSRVVCITPDAGAQQAIFPDVLNPARRAPSAQAGLAQGAAMAAEVQRLLEQT